jgi:hypothetical protein
LRKKWGILDDAEVSILNNWAILKAAMRGRTAVEEY